MKDGAIDQPIECILLCIHSISGHVMRGSNAEVESCPLQNAPIDATHLASRRRYQPQPALLSTAPSLTASPYATLLVVRRRSPALHLTP